MERTKFDSLGDPESSKKLCHDDCDNLGQDQIKIFLVTNYRSNEHELLNCFCQQGRIVHHTNNYAAGLDHIRDNPDQVDLLVFDMDLLPDIQAGVDEMIRFRAELPEIRVLLLSSSVQRDEFSDHRRAIGDATLRKPVSCERFLQGLTALEENFAARK